VHTTRTRSPSLLKREGDVGTISVGKLADFTVLSDNPFTIDPMAIKDIAIPATVLAGRVQYNRAQHA
jgi:predicted amidohydrolase YtcJ